ncbi:5320_t:CDS:2 [Acaulospora morrowiae]|uniref:5320_t:CDS:1 n=1 Tax=Acaulospora morrowiae TaxID=94023 RepID=A0A9N9FBF5_9GLOM|nr:5320_t:CDS:2 [Acaulospora morrowiae]
MGIVFSSLFLAWDLNINIIYGIETFGWFMILSFLLFLSHRLHQTEPQTLDLFIVVILLCSYIALKIAAISGTSIKLFRATNVIEILVVIYITGRIFCRQSDHLVWNFMRGILFCAFRITAFFDPNIVYYLILMALSFIVLFDPNATRDPVLRNNSMETPPNDQGVRASGITLQVTFTSVEVRQV